MKNDKKTYPDWVEKHHSPNTTIREVNGNYYLYSCTSKYIKGKKYPLTIQKYIGKISEEEGLIKPETISFIPEKDNLVQLRDEFDLSDIKDKDKEILKHISLLKISSLYYVGKLNAKELKLINKYFKYSEGVLVERL